MDFSNTYPDTHNPKSGHMKVLFKPKRNIQARELNEIQSIFRAQVKSFADHMFKNGTKISDARSRLINYHFIEVTDAPQNSAIKEGMVIRGRESGQEAIFILANGTKLAIEYKGSNSSQTSTAFKQNELIDVYERSGAHITAIQAKDIIDFSGVMYVFVIERGTFYHNGCFVENDRQLIPVDMSVDCEIGFAVINTVVSASYSSEVLDNNNNRISHGQAGADREKITLRLINKKSESDVEGAAHNVYETTAGYIPLAAVRDGTITYIKSDTEYSDIGDFIANRTYEESGNYTVIPFMATLLEHKARHELDGLGVSIDGSADNYAVKLTPGIAYVRGHRVETIGPTTIISKKSRDTKSMSGHACYFNQRTYMLASPTSQSSAYPNDPTSVLVNDGSKIGLYDDVIGTNNLPSGSKIGEMTITDTVFEKAGVFRYYIGSVSLNAGKSWNDVKSFHRASSTFSAMPVQDDVAQTHLIYNDGNSELIWDTGIKHVKSMRDIDDARLGSIVLSKRKKLRGVVDSSGTVTFKATSGEYFKPMNRGSMCVVSSIGVYSSFALNSTNVTFSPESITVNAQPANAGKTITVIVDVASTNQTEKKKTLTKRTQVTNGNSLPEYILDRGDVTSIKVWNRLSTQSSTPEAWVDVTHMFNLFNGCKDTHYENAVLKRNTVPGMPAEQASTQLVFEFEYFHHTGSAGYFNVDSYAGLEYGEIPFYKSVNGKTYDLSSCFDFRPLILNSVIDSQSAVPAMETTAIFDVEYYLPRVDTVCARKDGALLIWKGVSSESPVPAELEDDHMALYHLHLPAYVKNLSDVVVKYIDNKRYTMQDIGRIDDRLSMVEYYTSLSLLEKSAADMSIKDVNGLDRFKNGFIADNFGNFQAADVGSGEFRAAIDRNRTELRPGFKARNVKLVLKEHTNAHLINGMAYLPYNHIKFIEQPAATTTTSLNPYFIYTRRGKITLTPNSDAWADTSMDPVYQTTIDTGTSDDLIEMSNANGNGQNLGDWTEINRTIANVDIGVNVDVTYKDNTATTVSNRTGTASTEIITTGSLASMAPSGGLVTVTTGGVTTTTTTTTETTTFDITQWRQFEGGVEVSSRTDTYSTGKRVTEANLYTYMREIEIEFKAEGLMPGVRVYAFFNDTDVNQWCRPIDGEFGQVLRVSASGTLIGIFKVPPETFFVGNKTFKLTGDPTGGING